MSADTRKLVTNENLSAFAERLAEKVPLKSDLPTKVSDLANDRGFTDNAGTITSVTINGVTTSSGGVNLGYLVAAENGKGLSSNDYTTTEKNKLAGIASGAEANTIETVKVNGTALTPDGNKAVDVTVPTTVAELSDASNYALASDLEDYAQVSDLEDTEEVLTAAVTDLNSRLEDAEDAIGEMSSSLETLQQDVRDFPTNVSDFDNDAGYISTETDPVFTASPAAGITAADITNWNGKTSNTGTITGITMNGASKGTSGVVNLGTVITSETQLSKGTTTGSGNAVTDISVSNHQITLTKGTTFLTSHQSIKTINNQTITGTGNVTIDTLPTVTSSDNGKILQVVNGAWALVTPVSIYTGSGTPSNSTGNDGDLYLQS